VKQYQHTTTARIYNRVISRLLRIGIPIGPMALLTVPGRQSGLPRSTPVALAPNGAGWHLVAAYGPVDWVKNLRAARRGTITMRGRRIPVTAQELPTAEAAPILRASLASAGPVTRRVVGPYFATAPGAPLDDWMREAAHHPVFILTEAAPTAAPANRGRDSLRM
jgi:deazaflavin-dependent oxidoreductase (nitroreductase family)